jgi:6-phosphogluconolactonase
VARTGGVLAGGRLLKLEILHDADAVARAGAALIAEEARAAVAARGGFAFAVSGGSTPWRMLRLLADEELAWEKIDLFQVDERIAPDGDPERNLTHLRESLLCRVPLPPERIHAMPVDAPDLERAAREHAGVLRDVAGSPPVLDLVHLGLGADGHTASLVPGDAVLEVRDAEVALTSTAYQGRRRMTLTYPVLDRARRVLWLVSGSSKVEMLERLRRGDASIPAGRVRRERALLLVDRDALAGSAAAAAEGRSV